MAGKTERITTKYKEEEPRNTKKKMKSHNKQATLTRKEEARKQEARKQEARIRIEDDTENHDKQPKEEEIEGKRKKKKEKDFHKTLKARGHQKKKSKIGRHTINFKKLEGD